MNFIFKIFLISPAKKLTLNLHSLLKSACSRYFIIKLAPIKN